MRTVGVAGAWIFDWDDKKRLGDADRGTSCSSLTSNAVRMMNTVQAANTPLLSANGKGYSMFLR